MRLASIYPEAKTVPISMAGLTKALFCDLAEQDREEIPVNEGTALVTLAPEQVITVRLICD